MLGVTNYTRSSLMRELGDNSKLAGEYRAAGVSKDLLCVIGLIALAIIVSVGLGAGPSLLHHFGVSKALTMVILSAVCGVGLIGIYGAYRYGRGGNNVTLEEFRQAFQDRKNHDSKLTRSDFCNVKLTGEEVRMLRAQESD